MHSQSHIELINIMVYQGPKLFCKLLEKKNHKTECVACYYIKGLPWVVLFLKVQK